MFQIAPFSWRNRAGFAYPATDPINNSSSQRWKALEGYQKPKYAWIDGKTADCLYYAHSGLKTAVRDAKGIVFLAAGEVDLWTFHSAGIQNVISCYGEGQIPKTFADDLRELGVHAVIYLPDRDNTGLKSATKVRDALAGSGIHYDPRELPSIVGDKGDTNDLWQHVEFNAEAFWTAIETAPPLELPERKQPKPRRTTTYDGNDLYTKWVQNVVKPALDSAAPIMKNYRGDGWRHSPDPGRIDEHPSFRISYDMHELGVPMDAFGAVEGSWNTVASWLNLPDFKAWVREENQDVYLPPPVEKTATAAEQPPALENPIYDTPPDERVNVRYVSEMPVAPFLAGGVHVIASPQDTGKTALLERLMTHWRADAKTVRFISPFNTLTDELARRMDCESQLALYPDQQKMPDMLATTLPSLVHQVDRETGLLRKIDVVVLDEIEQTLAGLFADIYKADRMSIFNTLVETIRQAETVICLDADASSVTIDFMKTIRDDMRFVVNEYRSHTRQMERYTQRNALIKALDSAVKSMQGVIGVACTSEKQASKLAKRYEKSVGKKNIILICQSTKNEPRVKQFLQNPDQNCGQYRLVIYTSAMGTGVDISQTRADAVFGFFGRFPLTAWDMHQMLVRFRQADIYHVWVDKAVMGLETEEKAIYDMLLEREKRTKQIIMFSGGVNVAQEARLQLAKLQAAVEARQNRSKRNLNAHFFALARERFTMVDKKHEISKDENKQINTELRQQRDEVQAEKERRILDADPVDTQTYKRKALEGQLEPTIEAGHKRNIIEQTYGEPISSETIREYDDGKGVKQLLLLESLYKPRDESELIDHRELEAGTPLGDMTHATARRQLTLTILSLFLTDEHQFTLEPIELEQINERLTPVIEQHQRDIRRFFGWRTDYSDKPINLLRFILKECGLRLDRHRRGDGVKRYKINAERLQTMERYIRQRQTLQPPKYGESTFSLKLSR